MRKLLSTVLIAALAVSLQSISYAQCGDANNDGLVNIADVTYLIDYLLVRQPAWPDSTKADMDDRSGITLSDLMKLSDELFHGGSLDCDIDSVYYYTCSVTDTICIPFKYGIPDNVTEILLPVIATWSDSTRGYYFPMIPHGSGSNNSFSYVETILGKKSNQLVQLGDTILLSATEVTPGLDTLAFFRYLRVNPGVGEIVARDVDRSPFLRFAIEKGDYNLHRPIAIYKYPAGDLNCDTYTNVADLTYLVNWLFRNGPPPCNPYGGP